MILFYCTHKRAWTAHDNIVEDLSFVGFRFGYVEKKLGHDIRRRA